MLFGLVSMINAQTHKHEFDPSNARDGETVEYCLTHKKRAEIIQNNPKAAISFAQDELIRQQEAANAVDAPKATTYYIPVVFHLLHNYGPEYISDDQIYDAFEILNRDYDLQNPDAAAVVSAFNASNPSATSIPTDVDIQFRLATIAPDGTCFTGITHTVGNTTNSGNGQQIYNAIKWNNDVYQGEWPGDEYLNIFIAADIGGAAGYTYTPSNWIGSGMDNGIWVLHNYVGSIGTSSSSTSRTLTHECGHWLNLEHTWGPNNNPGNAASCNDDDGVQDTPECIGLTSCNLNANTCSGDNGYWGFDQLDNAENYMDYSYCSKMFTPGQVQRMRNAITSNVANRDNLITAQNLAATGADGNFYLCKAEFSADRTTICAGESVQFTDGSYNEVTSWNWTFQGGSPAGSSSQDPVVTYNTPGLYEVVLQASDGSNNDTETKTGYILVLPTTGDPLPIFDGFETYTAFNPETDWSVDNPGGNAAFELTTSAGLGSTNSAKLANYGQPAGNVDELMSAPVDLSGVTAATNMTLSFRYAYRQRNSNNDEWLKVFATNDCGDTWVQRKTIHGTFLSNQVETSNWTPTSNADWTTVHMTNITSSYWVENFRYKFRFESDGGNNFYLDNINIYTGGPSDAIVVGLEEGEVFADLNIYPNPTDADVNVEFTVNNGQKVTLEVKDVTGKTVQTSTVLANAGRNVVMLDTTPLAGGMYFLNITSGGQEQTKQFVVK